MENNDPNTALLREPQAKTASADYLDGSELCSPQSMSAETVHSPVANDQEMPAKGRMDVLESQLDVLLLVASEPEDTRQYTTRVNGPLNEHQSLTVELLRETEKLFFDYRTLVHTRKLMILDEQMKSILAHQHHRLHEKQAELLDYRNCKLNGQSCELQFALKKARVRHDQQVSAARDLFTTSKASIRSRLSLGIAKKQLMPYRFVTPPKLELAELIAERKKRLVTMQDSFKLAIYGCPSGILYGLNHKERVDDLRLLNITMDDGYEDHVPYIEETAPLKYHQTSLPNNFDISVAKALQLFAVSVNDQLQKPSIGKSERILMKPTLSKLKKPAKLLRTPTFTHPIIPRKKINHESKRPKLYQGTLMNVPSASEQQAYMKANSTLHSLDSPVTPMPHEIELDLSPGISSKSAISLPPTIYSPLKLHIQPTPIATPHQDKLKLVAMSLDSNVLTLGSQTFHQFDHCNLFDSANKYRVQIISFGDHDILFQRDDLGNDESGNVAGNGKQTKVSFACLKEGRFRIEKEH